MVQVIITTSGLGSRLGKMTQHMNKGMVRVGDKFVLDRIIDTYLDEPDVEFIFTIGYKGDYIKQYIDLVYQSKINYKFVDVDIYDGKGSSLGYSLLQTRNLISGPFIFHCNDSIIGEKINIRDIKENTLFVSPGTDSTQYCSISTCNNSNHVQMIHDKGEMHYDYIYIGVAYIKDFACFFQLLHDEYERNPENASLNDVIIYQQMAANQKQPQQPHSFKYYLVHKYCDTGNIDQLRNANITFKSNYAVLEKYNESISFVDDKVIKFFVDKKMNLNRVERIQHMPAALLPKIYNYSDNFFAMELVQGVTLSQVYTDKLIIHLLDYMFQHFWTPKETIHGFKDTCFKFYHDKTQTRIHQALSENIATDYLVINNREIGDIHSLIKKIDFNYLCDAKASAFHGDFILDNIILKPDGSYCLVDWRQDFQGSMECGDMYYDLAKLRHNIQFNHANIENKLFDITEISSKDIKTCTIDMKCNYYLMNNLLEFDAYISKKGLDLKKIKILNSLIWINMSPLHSYPLSNFLFNLGKYSLHQIIA